ncbi:hypothetical protein [Neokomagataea anthophila]|uniref:DUF106 domain-containing protein n=1 Tax=Neokomagataea anthophila TaxID=2826925 RepID=A0ABS5E7Z9_9PROT|nr:hypothetical protein [Neokomagataea anthophila]MBR0560034.1 hypothetical protein [Neokomagataea anthophila]
MQHDDAVQLTVGDLDNAPLSCSPQAREASQTALGKTQEAFFSAARESAKYQAELEEQKQKNKAAEHANNAVAQLNLLITPIAKNLFRFICCYCTGVGVMVSGNKWLCIPEATLNFMVGSTAVSIFGLFGTILMSVYAGVRPKR